MQKAVSVGINNYYGNSDLKGCLRDSTNIKAAAIQHWGYLWNNVSLLADGRASKKRIFARLDWAADKMKAGDSITVHFSGHGSQVLDLNGDEKQRNVNDTLDEILCLGHMDFDNPDTYITDDELNSWTESIHEGVKLLVLLDSCHSGTGTRDILAERKARYIAPPMDIASRVDPARDYKKKALFGHIAKLGNPNHTLISGCRDDQTSADAFIDGQWNGAFTYYFCKAVRAAAPSSAVYNYKELVEATRRSLSHNGYTQVPQLEQG